MSAVRLGTRRSALATAQSQRVADLLFARSGQDVELVGIATHGDRSSEPLAQIGGTGVFVSALRDALLAGEVDLAVHSLKDLPTAAPDNLLLAAVPEREDPRDVLCARDGLRLADLPPGSRVGSGSLRRAAQLRLLRPDLEVVSVRGNVETRLGLVATGEVDAVVLAYAGLSRVGRLEAVTETLDPASMLPAPGQGALAVECRPDDAATMALVTPLDHWRTRAEVTAERALLSFLEAGCTAPVGAHAQLSGADGQQAEMVLEAVVASVDGRTHVRTSATGSVEHAAQIGHDCAAKLLADGAGALVGQEVDTIEEGDPRSEY